MGTSGLRLRHARYSPLRRPGANPANLPGGAAPTSEPETSETLRTRILGLQAQLQEVPGGQAWPKFVAWWRERASEEGWHGLDSVPDDDLKAVVIRMERDLAEVQSAANA